MNFSLDVIVNFEGVVVVVVGFVSVVGVGVSNMGWSLWFVDVEVDYYSLLK